MTGLGWYSNWEAIFVTLFFTGPCCALMLGVGCCDPGSRWIMPMAITGYIIGAAGPWVGWYFEGKKQIA